MPSSPQNLATSFASLKRGLYCSLATKMEGNSLREKKTKRKNLNVQHAVISKSLCRKMTKWNCEKSGSTEHWLLSIFLYPFSVETGGNVKCFLNWILIYDRSHESLVPVQESKGPHLEVTCLIPTKERTIPSTNQNSLCLDLVDTSPSVIQLEFCLSKDALKK